MKEVDEKYLARMVEFINVAAGEGIWFSMYEKTPDHLDAASILYDWFNERGDTFPDWVPLEIKEDFGV